jgi:hypothetical protein
MNDATHDPWQWWQTACAHPEWIGTEKLPIHEGEPEQGFFRVRRKAGQWEAVQFWKDAFNLWHATRDGVTVESDRIADLWLWACRAPISEEAFDRAIAGKGWIDEPPAAPGIGDNIREADPHDALQIEWLGEKENAEAFLKEPIADKAAADRAAIWARRLKDIANKADDLHRVEKQPSLDEGRRVDDRWRELRDGPAELSKELKRHQTKFLQEEDRKERARVAAAKAEADRLRREAEEAALAARTPDAEAEAGAKIAAAQEAARDAEFRRPQAGRTGARTSLRTFRSGRITDLDSFLMAAKDAPEIQAAAQQACDRLARARIAVAGMTIEEDRRAV